MSEDPVRTERGEVPFRDRGAFRRPVFRGGQTEGIGGDRVKYEKDFLLNLYGRMAKIRHFEETILELEKAGEFTGLYHLYIGEEAVAVGVCANLKDDDYITSTHRGHGHCIAKGADVKRMMAELFAKKTGYCKGLGGSMHIADFAVGMLGANGIVGGGYNIAAGAALASWIEGRNQVAVCFFGDGASNRGTFHEALNMASVYRLPLVYVCENNEYAASTSTAMSTCVSRIADRAAGYGIPGVTVDGNDVIAVYEAARKLVERARAGDGPGFLECLTYRHYGHVRGDAQRYRSQDEVQERKGRDPLVKFRRWALGEGLLSRQELDGADEKALAEVKTAVELARLAPEPEERDLYENVYAYADGEERIR